MRHAVLLHNKTCLLVQPEDMSSFSTAINVFLLNTKTCLLVNRETYLLVDEKTCLLAHTDTEWVVLNMNCLEFHAGVIEYMVLSHKMSSIIQKA